MASKLFLIPCTGRFSTRVEVEGANTTRLNKLTGETILYQATETAGLDSKGQRISVEVMARLLDRLVVPKQITLKVPFGR